MGLFSLIVGILISERLDIISHTKVIQQRRENMGADPLIIERIREKRDDQVSLAKVLKEMITDIS